MKEQSGNRHTSKVTGANDGFATDPATEHQEPARGDAPRSNEIDDPRRPAKGPRTHDDTRFTRKDGD